MICLHVSRVLVIGSDVQVSQGIGRAPSAAGFLMEHSAGHADAPSPVFLTIRSEALLPRFR